MKIAILISALYKYYYYYYYYYYYFRFDVARIRLEDLIDQFTAAEFMFAYFCTAQYQTLLICMKEVFI